MRRSRRRVLLLVAVILVAVVSGIAFAPSIAAGGLLYPARRTSLESRPANCDERHFRGDGVMLSGWYCRSEGARRATIVYLHGIADNRGSGAGAIPRLTRKKMDVVAYDSRRHGTSEGDICTYGFFEKNDLRLAIDALEPGPIVLIGTSLGAAVALQEAADDPRVKAVVAAEVFSDLETIARERAPFFLPAPIVAKAFAIAERRGGFVIGDVSPVRAAAAIRAPVLLIHGEADRLTRPDHSRKVFSALAGPKRLVLVPGAGHNESLKDAAIWTEIDAWIDAALSKDEVRAGR